MGRITGKQDPPVAVTVGLPSVMLVARQPTRFSQGEVRAEHAADAVLELGQRHRCVVVLGGLVLDGVEHQHLGGE